MEVDLRVVDNVGSYAGKGYAQILGEVERVGIARAEALKQFGQVLALDEATSSLVGFTDGKAGGDDIGVLLAAVVKALAAQIFLVGDDIAPVLLPDQRVEGVGVVAYGVESADDAAHGRAGDDVYGYASPFEHLEHSNMCHTFSTAAAQHDGHTLTVGDATVGSLGARGEAQQDGKDTDEQLFH